MKDETQLRKEEKLPSLPKKKRIISKGFFLRKFLKSFFIVFTLSLPSSRNFCLSPTASNEILISASQYGRGKSREDANATGPR